MNISNILRVADAIEHATVPGLGFNMAVIYRGTHSGLPNLGGGESCGTVACIAGWTLTIAGTEPSDETAPPFSVITDMAKAAEELGLPFNASGWNFSGVAAELFTPTGYQDSIYTAEHAVRCLRNLAITGKVDWEAAMKPADPAMPALPVEQRSTERAA